MKRTIALALALTLLGATAVPALAEQSEDPALRAGVTVNAPAAALLTLDGAVLWEKDAHAPREPASVTKVMTLLLACEAIDRGELALTDTVTASAHAASMGGSQVWLKEGETLTVEELLKCIAIASANDCAVALGEHLAGTEEAFVQQMNDRAAQLGMADTQFVNCCGLTAPGHVTSAWDIGIMSAQLLREHPWIEDYATLWQGSIRAGAFVLNNTNKLLKSYSGCIGLKTGFTSTAGYCVSAAARREGLTLIAVVLGSPTKESRSDDACALLNWGFAGFAAVTLGTDAPLVPIPVTLGTRESVSCRLGEQEPLVLPKTLLSGLEKRLELPAVLPAPVAEGEEIGALSVHAGEREVCRIPILAGEEVPRLTLWDIFRRVLCCAAMKNFMENS